eukprot:Tbor_TRINITY_DN5649_c0_g3::TRINITY_DN5649_c0_g3_i1::g.8363::m.8363/K13238/DCI; 3,2-trans-enoyl-CoA isomerase, mitochondrial
MFRRISAKGLSRCAAQPSSVAVATVFSLCGIRAGGPPPPSGPRGGLPDGMEYSRPQQGAPEMNEMDEQEPRGPAPKPEEDPKYFSYTIDEVTGMCTLKLGRKPVNGLSFEFMEELNHWLAYLGDCDEVKGLILSSSIKSIFSAGLDLNEMYQPKEERLIPFWSSFQMLFISLNTFPKPVVAAINGNAPAGGCILALACDYRIMADEDPNHKRPYRIGLNETKLGLVAPPWAMDSLTYVVGRRISERMLQLGETPTAKQAMAIGLVDEVVPEAEVLTKATEACRRFSSINKQARWLTRDMLRREVLQSLGDEEAQQQDLNFFASMVMNEDVQSSLKKYLDQLKKPKA